MVLSFIASSFTFHHKWLLAEGMNGIRYNAFYTLFIVVDGFKNQKVALFF